jgi:prepilin-type N-terminal cleavage/methylation domain-containing protein
MMSPRRVAARPSRGFSLVEVMVAMTLLSIILVVLAKFATIIAVRGRGNDLAAKRTSALRLEANKFGAAPFSTLAIGQPQIRQSRKATSRIPAG